MASLSNFLISSLQSVKQTLTSPASTNITCIRHASKKASTSTRYKPGHPRPKHRGWRVQDGGKVTAGTIVATQRTTRFHPGLNVGFGRNGTLFAMEAGRVMVTCEKVNLNWDHSWVIGNYSARQGQTIYKKHFNVIPEKQHDQFKLIDLI